MTHEQIESAVERLRELGEDGRITTSNIVDAIFDGNNYKVRDTLIAILEQADPDTHMSLPVDADGVPIRVGDEVEGIHLEDGTVVGIEYREDGLVRIGVRPHEWDVPTWRDPAGYRHCRYHTPTVESVLREFVNEWIEAESEGDVFAKYAEKIREVMADE